MFVAFSGEFAALIYLWNIYLLSVASPLIKTVSAVCVRMHTADWLLSGSMCNQSDGAAGGTTLETE